MVKPGSGLRIVTIVTQILLNHALKSIKITINYKYCCSLNVRLLQLQCFLRQALVSYCTNQNRLLLTHGSMIVKKP
jgi:hypothetical protein